MKKKVIKSILLVVGVVFIFTSGVVAATLTAKDVGFTASNEEWQVNNVEDAVNDLYNISKNYTTNSIILYHNYYGTNLSTINFVNSSFYASGQNASFSNSTEYFDITNINSLQVHYYVGGGAASSYYGVGSFQFSIIDENNNVLYDSGNKEAKNGASYNDNIIVDTSSYKGKVKISFMGSAGYSNCATSNNKSQIFDIVLLK